MKWRMVTLGEVCTIEIGRTPSRSNASYWGVGHPWLSIADMKQGRIINHTKEQITPDAAAQGKLVAPGTVLLSFKLSIGKVAVAGVPLYTNEAIAALRVRDATCLDEKYLARALERMNLSEGANRAAMGATLNKSSLHQLRLPLPPIKDQRRIATILDRADDVRQRSRRSLDLIRDSPNSLFANMFTDDAASRPLSEVVRPGTIVTYGIVQAGPEYEGGVPYIRTGDIVNGRINVSGLNRTHPKIAAKFDRSKVRTGDLVMSIRATVGTIAAVPPQLDGANLTQGTARISPSDLATGPYLLWYLQSADAQRWIQAQVKGATFREITLSRLRELPVPIVSPSAQAEFARRVERTLALEDKQAAAVQRLDDLFNSLQSRAFRGEL